MALVLSASLFSNESERSDSSSSFWQAIDQDGVFVLMRHALAPGTGDPDNFSVDDCSTQRNLSQVGRDQAARIGTALPQHTNLPTKIISSAWCRCMETAELLDSGQVEVLPALNSFFRHYEREPAQTSELKQWMAQREGTDLTILVTHQVNITA